MCFSLAWIEQVLIWIVVIAAIIGLLQLLVSFLLPRLSLAGEIISLVTAAVRIMIWAAICIFAIIIIFELISCLLGGAVHLPR